MRYCHSIRPDAWAVSIRSAGRGASRRLLALLLFMLMPLPCSAVDELCLKMMAEIALLKGKEDRIPSEVAMLKQMKNSEARRPIEVDLAADLKAPSEALLEIIDPFHYGFLGVPSLYEESILELRAGDTVLFDEEPFLLGSFLGMGNTTQIYQLKNYPDYAIRIPLALPETFPLLPYERISEVDPQTARMENHLIHLQEWVHAGDEKLGVIGIQRVDSQHRFAVTNYVSDAQNGYEVLTSLARRHGERAVDFVYPDDFRHLAEEERQQVDALFTLMVRNGEVPVERGKHILEKAAVTQYLWGRAGGVTRWWLVDPERQ